MVCKPYPYPP
ncbi:hypothetical protein LINPERHAP1_LOCUS4499 [Linum perenne]